MSNVVTLEEDRPLVSRSWIASFGLMYLGINIAWAAPAQLLIQNQIMAWHPEDKEALLATIMTAGGILGLIASPIWGWVSDRTKSRLGPRAPWIILSAVTCAAALCGMAFASTFAMLLTLWCIFQLMIAAATNVSQAIPPDRVAQKQYGFVSALMGIGWTLAIVIGTVIGESFSISVAYFLSAGLLILLILPYLLWHNSAQVLPNISRVAQEEAGSSLGGFEPVVSGSDVRGSDAVSSEAVESTISGFAGASPSARKFAQYHDYIWVFISRLVVTLGNNVALFYLLYYLKDFIGYADPDRGVLILTVVYAAVTVVAAILSGKLSDRFGRRKPFVFLSCVGVGIACVVMAVAQSFALVVVAAIILGIGWGTFTAIDQALINQVLPNAGSRGRDIGVMSLAVAVPSMFAPAIAAVAVLNLGGYPGLYLIAAALSVLGGVAVLQVRGCR